MDSYTYKGEIISSTRVRECILEGNVSEAANMLPKPYFIKGKVVYGKQLGRTIGIPTANLEFDNKMVIPEKGVYYTNVKYNGNIFKGLTSVGYNPTVNGKELTIETHILNFNKMIYGEELKVYFVERIRDELKFDTLDELVKQIRRDEEYVKNKDIII